LPKGVQDNRNTSGLRPLNTLSEEEAHAIRSKGGQVRAEQQRQEKTLRNIIRKVMDARPELTDEETAMLYRMGISAEDVDNLTLGVLQQVKNMREGAIGAFEMLMTQGGYVEPNDPRAVSPVTIINDIPRE